MRSQQQDLTEHQEDTKVETLWPRGFTMRQHNPWAPVSAATLSQEAPQPVCVLADTPAAETSIVASTDQAAATEEGQRSRKGGQKNQVEEPGGSSPTPTLKFKTPPSSQGIRKPGPGGPTGRMQFSVRWRQGKRSCYTFNRFTSF